MCAVKIINKKKVGSCILESELAVIKKVKVLVMMNDDQNCVQSDQIIKILDIFEDSYLVYIVMEYMGGGDLHSRLVANTCFSG